MSDKVSPQWVVNKLFADKTTRYATLRDDKSILYYDGGIFCPYGDTIIHGKTRELTLEPGTTTHLMNEVVNLIKWSTYVSRDDFDCDPDLINMDNGLYSLTKRLQPHTREYMSLHKSPIKYDIDAECPAIDKFIREVVGDKYAQTIYEIFGYAMCARKNMKRAFVFEGGRNSGKSKMVELLEHLVGARAITHVSPLTVSRNTYGAAEYFGKSLNVVDDLGNSPLNDNGVLKSIIGGGRINAQFKYAQPFDFTPNVLCVFATNELPITEPFDEAFASRFTIIPFMNRFEDGSADPDIMGKLTNPGEMSGLFNKCMDALIDLRERGSFAGDTTLADRIMQYRYVSNPVERFLDECCITNEPDDYIMKDTLYRAYVYWSERNKVRTEQMKHLTMSLASRGGVVRQVRDNNGERKRAYIGVCLKSKLGDF